MAWPDLGIVPARLRQPPLKSLSYHRREVFVLVGERFASPPFLPSLHRRVGGYVRSTSFDA